MEETEQKIINLATTKFSQFGIRSVSVDDICNELHISKKTFYFYFNQKEDLIGAVLEQNRKTMREKMEKMVAEKTALECLLIVAKAIQQLQDVRKEPPFIYDLRKYYPENLAVHLKEIEKYNLKFMAQNLRQGICDGVYRDDLDVELSSMVVISRYHNVMENQGELSKRKISPIKYLNVCIDFFIRAIISEKGRKMLEENQQ